MKVVHLNTYGRGGAAIAAHRLHDQLNAIGVESKFLTQVEGTNKYPDAITYEHKITIKDKVDYLVNKKYINSISKLKELKKPEFDWFSSPYSLLRPENLAILHEADIIHLHWVSDFLHWPSFFKKLIKKPIVWTLHDENAFTGGCHYAGSCEQFKETCQVCPQIDGEKNIMKQFTAKTKNLGQSQRIQIITPSEWMAGQAKQSTILGHFSINTIPNGVTLKIFTNHGPDIRSRLKIEPDEKVILFIADNITNQRKGFSRLLAALKYLDAENYPLTCLVLGDGNLDSLPTTKHRIIQLKSIDSEEHMAEVYRTGNLFVTAAIEDNYPNTIIESLCCGTPVVGYSATGIAEMVKANFGITADPKTANSLAHVIRQGLETQWDKARIAKEAHALWNVELQADRYLAEYKKLLASS